MIPVRLKMRNFMCYREVPVLSFEGIHTACLAGDNGSGKSAIIDAMTWAVWGKARTRSDDDLIHTREREMEVEFDFRVGGQLYRVIRKRSRPKKATGQGQSILDFQIVSNSIPRSVAGLKTETQATIINTLHMDYDTFVNSAYLRQGHADEFTTQIPSKRKEVLSNILGLSDYDVLEGRAKEMAKGLELEKSALENSLQEIAGELAQKPILQGEFDKAQNMLAEAEKSAKAKEVSLNDLRQQKELLERKKAQLEQLEASIRSAEKNLKVLEEQFVQHQSRVQEYQALIAQRGTIEEGYQRLAEARKLNEELNQKLATLVKLNEHRNQLISTIDREQARLERESAVLQSKIQEQAKKAERLSQVKDKLAELQTILAQLEKREDALNRQKQTCEELQRAVSFLESGQSQLEHEIEDLHGKVHLLEAETGAVCPLCERELTADGRQLIQSKFTAEAATKTSALKSAKEEFIVKRKTLESTKAEVAQAEADLKKQRATVEGGIAVLKKEQVESEKAKSEAAELRLALGEVEKRLTDRDFVPAEHKQLRDIEAEIARLSYDDEKHKQVNDLTKKFEPFQSRKYDLEKAEKNIKQEKATLTSAKDAAQEARQAIQVEMSQRQVLFTEVSRLPDMLLEFARTEKEHRLLLEGQKQAQEAFFGVKTRLERCAELETKKKEKEEQLNKSAREEDIYTELARAFGKTGVQALLIELALPEIENEANLLLNKMTDNRMHVKFDTQRTTKKGETAEVLDINISDELGTRSYEMFSGGEAFRINFAIRIALSRLLARRAGAPLPTLIIDEGFGTQDTGGIEKLKESITSIQDDFEKILVITHIEELRDAFPTRIDVVKTADGSTFTVS